MRIWHQSFTVLDDHLAHKNALAEHAKKVARPDTEFVLHDMKKGTYLNLVTVHFSKYSYFEFLNTIQILENVLQAEREEYDAVAICCFQEPGLHIAKSIVNIPVVGLVEASISIASMLGRKISFVTWLEEATLSCLYEKHAHSYGLEGRLAPTAYMKIKLDEKILSDSFEGEKAKILIDCFIKASEEAIKAGAEVIIPGKGMLNEFLFKHGVNRIDDVPIVDTVGALIKVTEALVDLQKASGISVSRKGIYASPPKEWIQQLRDFYGF
jgi:Asp/Glu/hydantoin racemase